jgi:putative peptidoglycan lipid II flippase
MLIQVPQSYKFGAFRKPSWKENKHHIYELMRLLLPTIFVTAVVEINMLVDTMLASTLPTGSMSALYYGHNVMQFPLGLIAISITTATMPSMSESTAKGDMKGLSGLVSYTLRSVISLMVPIVFMTIALRWEIIRLLFERGRFTATESTPITVAVLAGYIPAVIGHGGVRVISQAFYTLKDTKTTVYVGVVSVIINIFMNFLLIHPYGAAGLAFATTVSAFFNFFALFYLFEKKNHILEIPVYLRAFMGYIVVSLVCALLHGFSHEVLNPFPCGH